MDVYHLSFLLGMEFIIKMKSNKNMNALKANGQLALQLQQVQVAFFFFYNLITILSNPIQIQCNFTEEIDL